MGGTGNKRMGTRNIDILQRRNYRYYTIITLCLIIQGIGILKITLMKLYFDL